MIMSAYRFYVPDLQSQLAAGTTVTLPEDESHHGRAVLRLEAGSVIALFDGRGATAAATISQVTKRTIQAIARDPFRIEESPAIRLILCTAVPKGDRAEQLIDQASQLNAAAVEWLDCEHSVVKPREGGQKMEKWRRQAIESAKQCGRAHLLQIKESVSPAEKLRELLVRGGPRIFWLQPGDSGLSVAEAAQGAATIAAVIGPEGGWSAGEVSLFEAAVQAGTVNRVRLTSTVLRIETAAAAVAAAVMTR
jgi:16S rRNA (uracil1498-N3)-methyltransferase